MWSCASNPDPENTEPHAGSGGAAAGVSGSATDVGGVAGSSSGGGGQSGATPGVAGNGGSGGSGGSSGSTAGTLGVGGAPEPSMGGSHDSGAGGAAAGEGGAGGSGELPIFEGRCGEGWAATGARKGPELEGTVTPEVDGAGNWSFVFGRYRLKVAGKNGARITEFSLDGLNLIDPTGGSTFWPSPQQAYTWPPPAEIDTSAYVAEASATSLSLTSKVSKTLGISVRKRFWVNETSGVVSIEYQLVNEATENARWAPWEVTRVRAGGYTFAPRGPGNRTITQDSFQRPLVTTLLPPAPATGRIAWLDYPSLTLPQDNYLTEFDGAEGWLAHANRFGKSKLPVLFVKSFDDADDAALPTNQAEIQLWTSGTANPKLIEVEEQGEEQELAPGEAISWTVHWSACELGASVELEAGSSELAALARAHAVEP